MYYVRPILAIKLAFILFDLQLAEPPRGTNRARGLGSDRAAAFDIRTARWICPPKHIGDNTPSYFDAVKVQFQREPDV